MTIRFRGRTAHAAAAPWDGVNALDAMIQFFSSIGLLRQQLRDDARLHGVITHGGEAANVIPDLTEASFLVRAEETEYLTELMGRIEDVANGAALATGCTLELEHGLLYENRINNMVMARTFERHLNALGVPTKEPDPKAGVGSSDIGNVSRACPTIHPYVSISEERIAGHTTAFRDAAGSELGYSRMLQAAKAMALTAGELLARPQLLAEAVAEHEATMRAAMAGHSAVTTAPGG